MSQQEMNSEDRHHEEKQNFYPPYLRHSGQKIYPRNVSREVALRIQLWIAYISLALTIGASFIFAYTRNAPLPLELPVISSVGNLSIMFLVIIGVNIAVSLFLAKIYRR